MKSHTVTDHITHLRNEGHRITKLRRAILEVLERSQFPISAQQILAEVRKNRLLSNKTSIYREVQFLQKERLVQAVRLHGRTEQYELLCRAHHHHVVCMKCNAIQDIPVHKKLSLYEKQCMNDICKNTKFTVLEHSVEFFGLCGQCK